jgi:lysyl-tRNA synthetase class 2
VATEAEILAARRKRAAEIAARGEELFPARVPRELDSIPELREKHGDSSAEELERSSRPARVAGRLMGVRSFGKASFATLQADGDRLQLWAQRSRLGDERYRTFGLLEPGDIAFAAGPLVRTRRGELSVDVEEFRLLAKAYRPLPEKWHGLQDVEARYRQRYLDLLVNERAREVAVARSRAVSAMREFLDARGFLEVETPILHPLYGGAHARPFETHFNAYDERVFLRISDELYLKRLIIGGLDRIYEIGRNFRNEGVSRKRNPEFTMLEAYQAYADYRDMMELVEGLVAHAVERATGGTRVRVGEREVELAPPWTRASLPELILEKTGIDLERAAELEELREAVRAKRIEGVDPAAAPSWGVLVDEVWSAAVEPDLIEPTFALDYPVELSPLAKRSPERPRLVERFEAFVGGMEIANAFTELNDPDDQRGRFEQQARARQEGDDEAHPLDEDFLRALEYGMPPTGGVGIGVGRLVMILTGAAHLREVKLFPYMRRRE